MRASLSIRWAALALLAALATACAKRVGDPCRMNTDCSLNGDRICDGTQPAGYCTVPECDPNACPDDSLCVEFEAHTPRLARRFCMQPCQADTDCRPEYRCEAPTVSATEACPGPMASGAPPPSCTRLLDTRCDQPAPDGGVLRFPACRTATRYCVPR
jgi:hypothetical protein